ncbi:MAG: glycosyltransferase [Bacteroidota bacterium]
MIVLLLILVLIYHPALFWLMWGAMKWPNFRDNHESPKTGFTVLVPFRNEAQHLPQLLRSFEQLNYPWNLMEFLLIDDESTDDSVAIIRQFERSLSATQGLRIRVLQNKRKSNSPKKDAITIGVEAAAFDWIVCTDADCRVPPNWLRQYDQCIQQKKPKMICGPVVYPRGNRPLAAYQYLDGLSLQLVSRAGFGWKKPMLCNGANMGYQKAAFLEVKGYEGNNHIASGDDVFLLEKMRQSSPLQLAYLSHPEATVTTTSEATWSGVIRQRIRWSSKTSRQSMVEPKVLGAIVFIANLCFLLAIALFLWNPDKWILFLWLMGMKAVADFVFLSLAAVTLGQRVPLLGYLFNVLIYPLVTVWVVLASFGGSYQWKERRFAK